MLTKLFQTIMAAPTIGTYTEKRIANQINILTKRLDELENNIKTPPFVIIYGVMDIPSEFTTDWKAHVNHILALNNIDPNWILSITTPHSNTNCSYFVSINFISHCIKETVFNILSEYIESQEFEGVYVTKDAV